MLGSGLGWVAGSGAVGAPGQALSRKVWHVEVPGKGGVLQRGPRTEVSVEARAGLRLDRVEVNTGLGALVPGGWTPLTRQGLTRFTGQQPLRPGWNVVGLKARQQGIETWTGSVRVGVGEVFLVAGQSNAVGSAQTLFRAPSDVRSARLQPDGGLHWQAGDDPQTDLGGGSPWPELGRLITTQERVPVGFINVAMGGTHIGDWAVGTPLHARLVKALEATRPHGVRAVLWLHGESSRSGEPEGDDRDYHATLKALIADSQRVPGLPPVPWVVARVGHTGFAPHPGHRRAQERLWREGVALPGPDLDDLGLAWREVDRVHLAGGAQGEVARRWLTSLKRSGLLGNAPAPHATPPRR